MPTPGVAPMWKPRMTFPVFAALVIALVIDTPQKLTLGPITLSGAITIALAAALALLSPMSLLARFSPYGRSSAPGLEPVTRRRWTAVPWPLAIFVTYAFLRWLLWPTQDGLQNVALYIIFVLTILIAATFSSAGSGEWALIRFAWVSVTVTVVFLASRFIGVEIYNERPYAVASVVLMAVLVPLRSSNFVLRIAPYLVLLGVVLSLSRTATVICLLLLVFRVVRGRRGKRLARAIAWIVTLASVGVLVVWGYTPFRERFFGGDNAITLSNGLTLNTSGRDRLWEFTISSWQRNPWFGNGPGSAQEAITPMFRNIEHPHNEYLRILHDFGIVGLALFALGVLILLGQLWQRARRYDEPHHWAALMSLLAVLAIAVTDNPLISQFVMIPVGALIGLSLSSPPPARSTSSWRRGRDSSDDAEPATDPHPRSAAARDGDGPLSLLGGRGTSAF